MAAIAENLIEIWRIGVYWRCVLKEEFMKPLKVSLIMAAAATMVAGCQKNSSDSASDTAAEIMSPYDVNKYAVNKTVCNPLGGLTTGTTDPTQGIHAQLWYLTSTQPRYSDVESVITNGASSDQNLFFSELYVPTRLFTEGFPLQSGGSINDDTGTPLIEYFALRFDTILHLAPNDMEGDYQLGILSDDGTIWSLSTDATEDNLQVALGNDGVHPTKLGCGPTISMTKSTSLAMRLDYFQGPRYHIALVPMWRLVNSCTTTESLCGQNGNSLYFNYADNSTPEPAFNQLISDGWIPLGVGNYSVSPSVEYNPCTQGTPPVISGLNVAFNSETNTYFATWTTDILATDQVLYTDTGSGAQTLTVSSNILSTNHAVSVTGMLPGHSYSIQAVSISQDLGQTISPG